MYTDEFLATSYHREMTFLWKIVRIATNTSARGYVMGVLPKKDIFSQTKVEGRRVIKRKVPGQ